MMYIERKFEECQYEFREVRSLKDVNHMMRQLTEKCHENNSQANCTLHL